MAGKVAIRKHGWADDAMSEIASALAAISAPHAFGESGRALIVEPRSSQIASALREAGFDGEMLALASVPIGERYGVAGGYARVVVADWGGRLSPAPRARVLSGAIIPQADAVVATDQPLEQTLGVFQSVILMDLTRYLAAEGVASALRWLAGLLVPQGCLALADPALIGDPDLLADTLNDAGMTLATDARIIDGDWPRTLTLWRRRSLADASKGGVARRVTWARLASDPRLQDQVVDAYQDVFGGDEWGEWVRCGRPGASHSYSRSAAANLNPPDRCECGWPEPLTPYHPAEDVLARLYRDLTPEANSAAYVRCAPARDAVDGAPPASAVDVEGFSWGYLTDAYRLARILRPEEVFAGATRVTLQRSLLDYVSSLGSRDNASAIYYHAELGVREGMRSLSLTRTLFERGLRFASERGARAVVLRTSKRSPVYRLLTGLGMRPIYWYDATDDSAQIITDATTPSRRDDRLLLAGDSQTLLEIFAGSSDTRLAVRIARGLREGSDK